MPMNAILSEIISYLPFHTRLFGLDFLVKAVRSYAMLLWKKRNQSNSIRNNIRGT